MYQQIQTAAYKRDLKKIKNNKQLLKDLFIIIDLLTKGQPLPDSCRDHKLNNSKKFINCRECHIRPDYLLIYQIIDNDLILKLIRAGSHSELFESNISRIYQHLSDASNCAIISAYRGENSLTINQNLHNLLKRDIRLLGLGYIEFVSRWVEDSESFDEESFLIPDISKADALELGERYKQASIIYKDENECIEICTTPFETYKPGDIVRRYNNVGPQMLNLKDAEDIFARRKGGPASNPKKGGKPFKLSVIEKLGPRPSYFAEQREQTILESVYEPKFTLRESDEVNAMMDLMQHNDQFKDDPYVGSFWYDPEKDELFGVYSILAQDADLYKSSLFNQKVRTGTKLHKDIWRKEQYKGKDKRFQGDHTLVPRGRVFQLEDGSFKVMVGDWINDYPQVKDEILFEFQLPEDTEFVKDHHWNLGHGFTDEFLEELNEDKVIKDSDPIYAQFKWDDGGNAGLIEYDNLDEFCRCCNPETYIAWDSLIEATFCRPATNEVYRATNKQEWEYAYNALQGAYPTSNFKELDFEFEENLNEDLLDPSSVHDKGVSYRIGGRRVRDNKYDYIPRNTYSDFMEVLSKDKIFRHPMKWPLAISIDGPGRFDHNCFWLHNMEEVPEVIEQINAWLIKSGCVPSANFQDLDFNFTD